MGLEFQIADILLVLFSESWQDRRRTDAGRRAFSHPKQINSNAKIEKFEFQLTARVIRSCLLVSRNLYLWREQLPERQSDDPNEGAVHCDFFPKTPMTPLRLRFGGKCLPKKRYGSFLVDTQHHRRRRRRKQHLIGRDGAARSQILAPHPKHLLCTSSTAVEPIDSIAHALSLRILPRSSSPIPPKETNRPTPCPKKE